MLKASLKSNIFQARTLELSPGIGLPTVAPSSPKSLEDPLSRRDGLSRPRLSARARDDSVGPSCFTIIFAFVCVWQWGVVMRGPPRRWLGRRRNRW